MSTPTPPAAPSRSLPLAGAITTRSLEAAIDAYLAVHPERREALRALAGKVLGLRLRPFDWQLFLCPTEKAVQVLTECSSRPDASISADLSGYLRLGLGVLFRETESVRGRDARKQGAGYLGPMAA